ncbi:MAG: indolepyruvate ferredoxin oxidoreductase family protein, partial [Acidimicrobiales bacterium]
METSTTKAFAPLPGERDAPDGEEIFLTGIQALVRVILDTMRRDRAAGLRTAAFVSGYPGSPLAGIDRELTRHRKLLEELDVVHLPAHNEEMAATAVAGSQLAQDFRGARYDGVLGAWYGKSPGLYRALDAVWHGQYTGASSHGGVLLFVGDDPAPKSSMVPSASELTLASLCVPTLYPGTVEEILTLGAHGVALSRASGLWTALKIVASVADGFGTSSARALHAIDAILVASPRRYVPTVRPPCVPEALETEQEILTVRTEVAVEYGRLAELNRVTVDPDDAWIGVVAAGSVYRQVVSAFELLGLDETALRGNGVRLMQVQMLNPLEPSAFRHLARGLSEIVVVEEKLPVLETHLRTTLYGGADVPRIVGRFDEQGQHLFPSFGVVRSADIARVLSTRLCR